MAGTIHDHLKAAYEDVEYVGRSNPHSQPDRLAAIATLFGLSPPDPSTARVLEVGCGDGANLLALAARMPDARFVGCDLSALLMGHARSVANGLGLANVELVEGDLRETIEALGQFDYIVAHGLYSWVPADVRDAFLALARRHLSPNGVVFVSYNVYPGCHVRRIVWDAMRLENAGATTSRERLERARRIRVDLAEAWTASGGVAAHLVHEFRADAELADWSLYHDDIAGTNDPVYFSTFAKHVGAHGLGYLAEAEMGTMGAGGLPPAMQAILASADPLAREQYLDFARVRRFRQSVLVAAVDIARARLTPPAIDRLHASALTGMVQAGRDSQARGAEKVLVDLLVERYPGSMSVPELLAALGEHDVQGDPRSVVLRACFAGAVELWMRPVAAATFASGYPRAFSMARWQAERTSTVTNLRHEGVHLAEESARAILAAADGTRDRAALAGLLGGHDDAAGQVDHFLRQFAHTGLLEA